MKTFASQALARTARLALASSHLLGHMARKVEGYRFFKFELDLKPEDIVIASYPRSGTTWMQMIVYQLCTDGNMDFKHISERQPWLERHGASHPIFREKRSAPRMLKTHLNYPEVPKGPAKYIYIYRDGRDVAVSYFHFYRSQGCTPGSFDRFFENFMSGNVAYGSWFKHVRGWRTGANRKQTLFVRYEDLRNDLDSTCLEIARFCGVTVDDALLGRVRERCSFDYMREHQSQFNPITELLVERGMHPDNFIRSGKTGAAKDMLTTEHQRRFQDELRRQTLETSPAY